MGRLFAAAAVAALLVSGAGCGTEQSRQADPPASASPTAPALMSTEEFCEDYDERELIGPLEDYMAAFEAFTDSLSDLTPSDRTQLEAGIGEVEDASQALSDAYLAAAARVDSEELAADIERFVNEVDALVGFASDAVLRAELPDSNPGEAFGEAFMTMARHCE